MLEPVGGLGIRVDRESWDNSGGRVPITLQGASGSLSYDQTETAAGELVLEDEELLVAFDRGTGALTRMQRKSTHWTIERRPTLAASFRLHAPLPNRRDNFVLGSKQRTASAEKIDRKSVV